jgi:hypothetical protein
LILRGRHKLLALAAVLAAYLAARNGGFPIAGVPAAGAAGVPPMFPQAAAKARPRPVLVAAVPPPPKPKPVRGARLREKGEAFGGTAPDRADAPKTAQ